MKSASYLQSVLVEYKTLFGIAINAVQLSSAIFLSHLFGKLLVMEEDRTNTHLERLNTSLMQTMIRVFLENSENPFSP